VTVVLAGAAVVDDVLPIVNAAYATGEAGLWQPGVARISAAALRPLVAAGELAIARREGAVVGCVRIGRGELGLLACAPEAAGTGVGRALVSFAEERNRAHGSISLELLVPREGTHPFKERLHAWYSRLGYRVVGRRDADFDGLAVACEMRVYSKPL
jgi:GNAT superfamily N-acetyltransferase